MVVGAGGERADPDADAAAVPDRALSGQLCGVIAAQLST
ncbi:putative protein without homology [Propionibacterium freudenreichii subsp. shermanii]|nr:putative protein without homology [Propionibacterium freudenreichii subsp. shermanii]